MKNLSLTETKVSIRSEVIAGIVFESRPVCEVSQLLKIQARNFEKAHKELASNLAKIKHEETRKIQQARRMLEEKMIECDDKNRELDSKSKLPPSLALAATAFLHLKLHWRRLTMKIEP